MGGSPRDWKEREEKFQREQKERDKLFEKTLNIARKQSWIIRTMLAEEEHKEKREDMRSGYLQHGTCFDPYPIQGAAGPSRHEIDNALSRIENAIDNAVAQLSPHGGQLVGGVQSPPPLTQSQRGACDMLGMSPTSSPREWLPTPMGQSPPTTQAPQPSPRLPPAAAPHPSPCPPPAAAPHPSPCPPPAAAREADDMELTPPTTSASRRRTPTEAAHQERLDRAKRSLKVASRRLNMPTVAAPLPTAARQADDMDLTPPVTSAPPRMTPPEPAHLVMLERTKRALEEASKRLNTITSNAPHPLSRGFSIQKRQPLGTLYDASTPSTSRAAPEFDDPRLHFRSRLSPGQQAPSPTAPARTASSHLGAVPRTQSPCTTRTRRPASASPPRPTRQTVQAAAAAGTLRGTQSELEAMGFLGTDPDEVDAEHAFVDQMIDPYQCPPPEVIGGQAPAGLRGLLKDQGAVGGGGKKRVMLKRKVTKIAIPPRPDRRQVEGAEEGVFEEIPGQEMPYMYTPQDPQYSHRDVQILPPRRLTPSPVRADGYRHHYDVCQDGGSPRSAHQLQIRRDLETDWDRRQEAVPSREYESDKKGAFGRPLPKSFTTGKPKKHHSYRGGARSVSPQPTASTSFGMAMGGTGCPQTPTTRTGLVLRTPSTSSTTRSTLTGSTPSCGGSPGASRGRGGTRGSSPGGRGERRGGVDPTRSGSPMAEDELQRMIMDVQERVEHLELRECRGNLEPGPDPVDDEGSPVERMRQGFARVKRHLEKLQDLAERKITEVSEPTLSPRCSP